MTNNKLYDIITIQSKRKEDIPMSKIILFDMDGTVADLYGVANWLDKLNRFDPTPYIEAKPLVDMAALKEVCTALENIGYSIGVATWLSKNSTPEYDIAVTNAKLEWLENYMPFITEFHPMPFGTPKHTVVKRCSEMWLVDDSAEVRSMWNTPKQRKSINANEDIIAKLWELVGN